MKQISVVSVEDLLVCCNRMHIIHEETQKFSPVMGLLILFSLIIIVGYLVITWQKGEFGQIPIFALVILGFVLLLDIFFIINFYQMRTIVTEDKLIFGFGVLKRELPLENIDEVIVEKFIFNRYMGYGIRTGRDRSVGYVARSGNGVRIKVKNQKDLYITSDNAEHLKTMIETARGKRTASGNE